MKFGGWVRLGPWTNSLDFGSDPDVMTLYPDYVFCSSRKSIRRVESSGCHQCVPCREPDDIVCVRHVTSLAAEHVNGY